MSELIPYVQTDEGLWSLPDGYMLQIYRQMVGYDLLRVVFPDGEIKGPKDWMSFIKKPGNVLHCIGTEDGVDMIAWLNGIERNCAFGHFCCFPHTWGTTSLSLGRQCFNHWFGNLQTTGWKLDVICGKVPAFNQHASDYVSRLGMAFLGTIPEIEYAGEKQGANIFHLTRKEWESWAAS